MSRLRLSEQDAVTGLESAHTGHERAEIVARLADGWSNAAIARARGTSEKTVANQIGALLKKFGSGSRRALAAAVARDIEPGACA